MQAGRDANLNVDSAGDRAILNKAGRPGTGTDVINLCSSSLPAGHICNGDADPHFDVAPYVVGYLAKDPTAQYIRTGMGALSNLGRNTFPMQPINNWDLSVLKRIGVKERYKFEFGAQLLNVFNHPQFTPGYINAVNSANTNYTTASAARNYLVPGTDQFNKVRAGQGVFPSNARTMQLSAKFIF